jgi:hypothetical protein
VFLCLFVCVSLCACVCEPCCASAHTLRSSVPHSHTSCAVKLRCRVWITVANAVLCLSGRSFHIFFTPPPSPVPPPPHASLAQIVGIFDKFPRVYAVNFFEHLCPREDDAGVTLGKLEALLDSVTKSGKHEVRPLGLGGVR